MDEMTLRVSQTAGSTRVLGPGNRAVIWVHGCCFQCPGCLAQRYKTGQCTTYTPAQLAQWYLRTGAEGLTISGGEPMLQAGALAQTIALIRREKDTGVIVYSGFTYEALLEKAGEEPGVAQLLASIDLLIDGPYRRELDEGRPYIGSANQRLIPLSERYRSILKEYYAPDGGRKIEIVASQTGTVMVGVPDAGQLAVWERIKAIGEKNHGNQ